MIDHSVYVTANGKMSGAWIMKVNPVTGAVAFTQDGTVWFDVLGVSKPFEFTTVNTEGVVTASYTPEGGSAIPLTVSEDYMTIDFPLSALGIAQEMNYDIYDSDGWRKSFSSQLEFRWSGSVLSIKNIAGWTSGTWTLRQ